MFSGNDFASFKGFAYFWLAPAIYLIPGVGQVTPTATGAIVLGGLVIANGHLLYKTIKKFLNNPRNVIHSTYGIPKSLLGSKRNIKLGEFKDKNGKTPLNKNSGTFKNGKYTINKDTAGHGERKWKLHKSGRKVASLNGKGKVLSE